MATQKSESTGPASSAFNAEERAAMKEHATEMKKAKARAGAADKAAAEAADVLAKIAAMDEPDRGMAERLHAIVAAAAPGLAPKLWYGMPAYARAGKVVCFFQERKKFKTPYATLGFSEEANLDDGAMWPTSYALTELNDEVEARITELVTKAVS
ncbi:iron chaperone [Sinomonas mesophila]|uniref:iron chaperone n=1 Tax=Sinomonas mesophila TaxID=1531955 RepID=UPI00098756AA|nr:DUF1801 domain-containing protein [Sinomonas mesophila]